MFKFRKKKQEWKGNHRIFCVSMQRTGTTSVGKFFEHFGYPVARWKLSWENRWSQYWYKGDFDSIFNSVEFNQYQVFEDSPWWYPEFYKILFHRFPDAKFILFTRDSKSWFDSMVSHSGGMNPGNTKIHCKVYGREKEFYEKFIPEPGKGPSIEEIDNLLPLVDQEGHYRQYYETRNREVIDFFQNYGPERLFVCDLADKDKWHRLGRFFGMDVPKSFNMHANQSKKQPVRKGSKSG